MKILNNTIYTLIIHSIFIIVIIVSSCSSIESERVVSDDLLVLVGDRKITRQDFLRRAEYTPRPDYCRLDNPIHKKIVLNSLIAEKLFALNSSNKLNQNNSFKAFIKGRIEQSMRQLLYFEKAVKISNVTEEQLELVYRLSQRTYDLKILSHADSVNYISIDWYDNNIPELHQNLFMNEVEKGQELKPLILADSTVLNITVESWTNRIDISENVITNKKQEIIDFLKADKAQQLYEKYVSEIMKGKEIDFHEDTFYQLSERAKNLYLNTEEDKLDALNRALWDMGKEISNINPLSTSNEILNKSLFTLDGSDWMVSDILNLIQSHPLVFRKRTMNKNEFHEQFMFAIVDLIRDHFLTREAYKLEIDKSETVRLNKELWEDFFMAQSARDSILHSANMYSKFKTDQYNVITTVLNPVVDSLQIYHSNEIYINVDLFDEIDLTKIDMMVTQRNVPYPVLVPNFPTLTTDHKLNYGSKM